MDATLIAAGMAAALAAASSFAVPKAGASRSKNGRQGRKSQSRRITSSNAAGMNPTKRSDLTLRPPTMLNVPKSIPRNVAGILAWDTVKVDSVITTSTTTITETNYSWSLSSHPQASSWSALFDQYCVVQASVRFESDLPPGSTQPPAKLFTAIDFDNGSNLGVISAIEDFASCEEQIMYPQASLLRSVNPTIKPQVGSSPAAVTRSWVDCAFPSIPHFGIRSILTATTTPIVVAVNITVWFAFRNQI